MGPLGRLRIVCPLDELTGDAGDGFSGGGVIDLRDGATTIVEVRENFGETQTFTSKILGVDGGDDVGGPRGAKGNSVHWQM